MGTPRRPHRLALTGHELETLIEFCRDAMQEEIPALPESIDAALVLRAWSETRGAFVEDYIRRWPHPASRQRIKRVQGEVDQTAALLARLLALRDDNSRKP